MTSPTDRRFLFIHVMKTGGTSLAELLRANFAEDERYPDIALKQTDDHVRRTGVYLSVHEMLESVNLRNGQVRMVRGHVPYSVRTLLDSQYTTMTVLRNPVERTLSYLKHARKYHEEHRGWDIERIYEAPWFFESFIHNYQTKIFSMTAQEALAEVRFGDRYPELPSREQCLHDPAILPLVQKLAQDSPGRFTLELYSASTGVIQADQTRLGMAMRNLQEVELVGITERYVQFLEALRDHFGWRVNSVPRRNVSDSADIPSAFRSRIEQENALDMELYELAVKLAA